ncbi:MAG TPA: hypothetical protein VLA19_07195 [Herpetosiphonaceae bacterium]|nr:hypothetical protein [Herpetosiphonaceae bacterium]
MFGLTQAVGVQALRALGGFDPVPDALSGGLELTGEVFRSAPRTDKFNDLLPVRGWIRRV